MKIFFFAVYMTLYLAAESKNIEIIDLLFSDTRIKIVPRCFKGCKKLTQIAIPTSVTSIGESAFNKCSSLTEITIPTSVTSICEGAFQLCSSLIGKCTFP